MMGWAWCSLDPRKDQLWSAGSPTAPAIPPSASSHTALVVLAAAIFVLGSVKGPSSSQNSRRGTDDL